MNAKERLGGAGVLLAAGQDRGTNRYFIVIDDMRAERWCDTEPAFPADDGVSSRIVVTTNIQSVDNACSTADGYVYKIGKLNTEYSKDLFFQSASVEDCSPDMERGSEQLRKKCHGLPLALICVGQFFRSEGTLTAHTCSDVCSNLGHHLENKGNNVLARMHRALTMNYTCLLVMLPRLACYIFGMIPGNHPIKRKRPLRRWLAEGLVKKLPHPWYSDVYLRFLTKNRYIYYIFYMCIHKIGKEASNSPRNKRTTSLPFLGRHPPLLAH